MSTPASGEKTPPYTKAKPSLRNADRAGFKPAPYPTTSGKGPVQPDAPNTPAKGKQVMVSSASHKARDQQRKEDENTINKFSHEQLVETAVKLVNATRAKNVKVAELEAINSKLLNTSSKTEHNLQLANNRIAVLESTNSELTAAKESLAASNESLKLECAVLKERLDRDNLVSRLLADVSELETKLSEAIRRPSSTPKSSNRKRTAAQAGLNDNEDSSSDTDEVNGPAGPDDGQVSHHSDGPDLDQTSEQGDEDNEHGQQYERSCMAGPESDEETDEGNDGGGDDDYENTSGLGSLAMFPGL